jgi:hypothetical protein
MRVQNLGPHTFATDTPHPRHHAWLTRFSPRQRRELINEDNRAKWQMAGIVGAAMTSGIVLLVIVLFLIA